MTDGTRNDPESRRGKSPPRWKSGVVVALATIAWSAALLWIPWLPVKVLIAIGGLAFVLWMARDPVFFFMRMCSACLGAAISTSAFPGISAWLQDTPDRFAVLVIDSSPWTQAIFVAGAIIFGLFELNRIARATESTTTVVAGATPTTVQEVTGEHAILTTLQVAEVQTLNVHNASPPSIPIGATSTESASPAPESTPTRIDLQVEDAHALIRQGKASEAQTVLSALQRFHFNACSDRERFRIVANLGHALAASNDLRGAAEKYHEAQQYQSGTVKARELIPLATWYRGDATKAYAQAVEVIDEFPSSQIAHAVRIKACDPQTSADDLEATLPEPLAKDAAILDALYHKAMGQGDFRGAETYARRFLAITDDVAAGKTMLGTAILKQVAATRLEVLSVTLSVTERQQMVECARVLSEAIDELRKSGPPHFLATALRNHASATRALGNEQQAALDIADAYAANPSDPEIVAPHAFELARSGRRSEAQSLLEEYLRTKTDPQVRFLLSMLLAESDAEIDQSRGLDNLVDNVDEVREADHRFRAEWLDLAIAFVKRLNDSTRAGRMAEVLDSAQLSPISTLALRARLALALDKESEANRLLDEAIARDSANGDSHALRLLADVLMDAKRYGDAFSVYCRFVRTDRLTADTRALLHAGKQAGEDHKLLSLCKTLREADAIDPVIYSLEMELLSEYNEPDELALVLQDGVARFPDAPEFSVNLWLTGLKWDRPEWKCPDPDLVPPYTVVQPELGLAVVQVLVGTFGRASAAEYAYSLWRRSPDNVMAVQALITAILSPHTPDKTLHMPEAVSIGSAVAFSPVDSDRRALYVIVASGDALADSGRMELTEDHPLAVELLGKKVGDRFTEPATFGPGRVCEVLAITRADVHRAHELAQGWHRMFPEVPFIQSFYGSTTPESQPTLRGIMGEQAFEMLRTHGRQIDSVFELYRSHSIPIVMVARRLGQSVAETMSIAIREDRGGIHCAAGSLSERTKVQDALTNHAANGIVLDTTALCTLMFLGEGELLSVLQGPLFVTASTVSALRELLRDVPVGDEAALSLVPKSDDPAVVRRSPEELAETRDQLQLLLDAINKDATVVGGSALAAVPKREREHLRDWYPVDVAEAIAVAKERDAVLWTDDVGTAQLTADMWGTRSVWTMSLCWHLRDTGRLAPERVNSIGIRLNLWDYRFVGVWPDMVVQCLKDSDWDPGKPTAHRILSRVVQTGTGNVLKEAEFIASVVREVWREAERLPAEAVTRAILAKLGGHGKGAQIAEFLFHATDALFGLDVVGAARLKQMLQEWIRGNRAGGGQLVVPP